MDLRDCYLMVRRKKQTYVFKIKNTECVLQLKVWLQSLTKVPAHNIRLFSDKGVIMEDDSRLANYEFDIRTAPAEKPAVLTMVYRLANGDFEDKDVTPYALPSPLPEILQPSSPGINLENV